MTPSAWVAAKTVVTMLAERASHTNQTYVDSNDCGCVRHVTVAIACPNASRARHVETAAYDTVNVGWVIVADVSESAGAAIGPPDVAGSGLIGFFKYNDRHFDFTGHAVS